MSDSLKRDVVLVHSSDLHLSADSSLGLAGLPDPWSVLRDVLAAAAAARADLVVLAGDTFDHNRQPPAFIDGALQIMREFGAPVVILPGNHDPLTPDSVYRRADLSSTSNVCVLGLTVEERVAFPDLGLEIWGRAHKDYFDMSPLSGARSRGMRWRLAAAHGHYVEERDEPGRFLGSWLIRRQDLVATGADYVALGHWNRAARVGEGDIHAYYSGSPEYAGTVNVVRLRQNGTVEVTLAPVGRSARG
jgi:DNA repair exonuclease SbcCD nuclease subunit